MSRNRQAASTFSAEATAGSCQTHTREPRARSRAPYTMFAISVSPAISSRLAGIRRSTLYVMRTSGGTAPVAKWPLRVANGALLRAGGTPNVAAGLATVNWSRDWSPS